MRACQLVQAIVCASMTRDAMNDAGCVIRGSGVRI